MPAVRDPRLCVSLPVHEEPTVILDQVENLRSFLGGDTQVVIHLSASMGLDPAAVAPLLPEGVHVNPRSHSTQHGDIGHVHMDNLRFAYAQLEPFDYVVLHASNDLYVRPGAPARIAKTQAGFRHWPITADTEWVQAGPAHRDRALSATLADIGNGDQIYGAQVEGTFYAADLFREMLDRIGRHYAGPGDGEAYNREEVYFPTLASHLMDGRRGEHLAFVDVLARGPELSPAVIYAVMDGTLNGRWIEEDLYAVKRVARQLHHPNRDLIRALARATGAPRLQAARIFEGKAFAVLTLAPDVLADPTLVPSWHATFTGADDATLVVALDERDGHAVEPVIAALRSGGSDDAGAADVVLISTRAGSFEEASLRWTTHAVLRPAGAETPPLFDDAPLYFPERAAELRFMMERRLTTRRGLPGQTCRRGASALECDAR